MDSIQDTDFSFTDLLPAQLSPYIWREIPLAQGKLENGESIDLSVYGEIEEHLAYLSADLSFIGKALVAKKAQSLWPRFSLIEFFTKTGIHYDSLLEKIIRNLSKLPEDFVEWSKDKKLGPRDFKVFINDDLKLLNPVLAHVSALNMTKMNGLKSIELFLDLNAQTDFAPKTFASFKSEKILLKKMNSLRYPQTTHKDEQLRLSLSKVKLPKDVKLSAQRQGDQNKLFVNIKANHPNDLDDKLNQLLSQFEKLNEIWEGDF